MVRRQSFRRVLILTWVLLCGLGVLARASLFGPWQRYASSKLGVEIPVVGDWWVRPGADSLVFGLEDSPQLPVRLAIARIPAGPADFKSSIQAVLAHDREEALRREPCQVGGRPAIRIEGMTPQGPIRDYYVDRGEYWYWIRFAAPEGKGWEKLSKSFDIIMSDFRFLP